MTLGHQLAMDYIQGQRKEIESLKAYVAACEDELTKLRQLEGTVKRLIEEMITG